MALEVRLGERRVVVAAQLVAVVLGTDMDHTHRPQLRLVQKVPEEAAGPWMASTGAQLVEAVGVRLSVRTPEEVVEAS